MVLKLVGTGCRIDVIHWVRPRWGTDIFSYKNRLGGLHSKFTIFCVYITLFLNLFGLRQVITFLIKERLSWGSSRKFSVEWVITALFEVTEYSQNRSKEVSIGFLGCGLLKNNIDMAQWLNWSETPDPSISIGSADDDFWNFWKIKFQSRSTLARGWILINLYRA